MSPSTRFAAPDINETDRHLTPETVQLGEANLQAASNATDPDIRYGAIATPFGAALIGLTPRGLGLLQFLAVVPPELTVGLAPELRPELSLAWEPLLRSRWPQGKFTPDFTIRPTWGDRLFTPPSPTSPDRRAPLTLDVGGTPFQRRVWQALLTIPFGQVATYQQIATAIGQPQAARAVGTAIGRNLVAYLIPCHRVVRAAGGLGGYRWGGDRKAAILAWEAAQVRPHSEM